MGQILVRGWRSAGVALRARKAIEATGFRESNQPLARRRAPRGQRRTTRLRSTPMPCELHHVAGREEAQLLEATAVASFIASPRRRR
jgi:hypothetical protein